MANTDDWRFLISDLIKKQMLILGPNLVLSKARKVEGLKISDDGTVTSLGHDPKKSFEDLKEGFFELSGHITQLTLDRLFAKYPHLKNGN